MAKKRLFDMQIDEVSLVDRPANQHATITFSKSAMASEDVVEFDELYDEDGSQIDLDTLSPGDEIVGDDGETYVVLDDDNDYSPEDDQTMVEPEDDPETEVGKANPYLEGVKGAFQSGRQITRRSKDLKGVDPKKYRDQALKTSEMTASGPGLGTARRFGASYEANPGRYQAAAVGTGVTGLGAAGYGLTRKNDQGENMSFTDEILEELSKAVTDHERETVVAKMASELEVTRAAAEEAIAKAQEAEYREVEQGFVSKAAGYNLPVAADDFGPILMKMAMALDEDEFELVDKVFTAVGDALYDEIGYVGGGDNVSVLEQVDALADEMVGKADGAFSKAESVVAMLEANPEAYDAYLAEQTR